MIGFFIHISVCANFVQLSWSTVIMGEKKTLFMPLGNLRIFLSSPGSCGLEANLKLVEIVNYGLNLKKNTLSRLV